MEITDLKKKEKTKSTLCQRVSPGNSSSAESLPSIHMKSQHSWLESFQPMIVICAANPFGLKQNLLGYKLRHDRLYKNWFTSKGGSRVELTQELEKIKREMKNLHSKVDLIEELNNLEAAANAKNYEKEEEYPPGATKCFMHSNNQT